jgi:hypothetical protein
MSARIVINLDWLNKGNFFLKKKWDIFFIRISKIFLKGKCKK